MSRGKSTTPAGFVVYKALVNSLEKLHLIYYFFYVETFEWDMAENINTKDEVYAYLQAALEENNTETLFDVIGAIARSKGMMLIARELGLSRESLYKSLSPDGNPSFSTVIKVLDLLGYKMQIMPKSA